MKTLRTRTRVPLTIALAGVLLIGSPALAGCSLINNVVGSVSSGNVPEGLTGAPSVPSDFPGEVPLIDGDVVFGLSLGDEGEKAWNVSINVSGAEAFETIKGQLTDAGFEFQGVSDGDSATSGVFRKDDLTVLVAVAAVDGGQWTANYTVTNADTGA
ncbi:MAG: hypothetical protein ABIQ01_07475 [Pseudolysinimonas sp.]